MSFVAIGWQSSAFTSWNWSSGGSEEILQHPGFHVMAVRWLNMPQCVEVVQKRGCNMALYAIPPINTARAGSKMVHGLKRNKDSTPDQSQPSKHPFTNADRHIAHGGFANKVWAKRSAGKCLRNYQQGLKARLCACTQIHQQSAWLTSNFTL